MKKLLILKLSAIVKNKAGFSLVELLAVIAVLAMLSAILIQYSRTGERQLLLFREQFKLASTLSRAKSLAISTFNYPDVPCGYGVHFAPPRTFILFRDNAADCSSSDRIYSGAGESIVTDELDPFVRFSGLTASDILFIPPDPRVIITPAQPEATITLETSDGVASAILKVSAVGQITTQ
jgi:prepilin-type N-terminal cleavage/methylation domain-containing protein